jgi:hypothetical protein
MFLYFSYHLFLGNVKMLLVIENTENQISITELQVLLQAIIDHQLGICFRYRLLGQCGNPIS